ncbi:sialoadhesin [Discoglossus pictus]
MTVDQEPGCTQVNITVELEPGCIQVSITVDLEPGCIQVNITVDLEPGCIQVKMKVDLEPGCIQVNMTVDLEPGCMQVSITVDLEPGCTKVSMTVDLEPGYSPKNLKVLIKPSEENIKQGTLVTLTCQVNSSNPTVSNYTWYKDGKQLSRDQSISFHSISRTDHGEYRCEAQNRIGMTTSEPAQLVVFSANTLVSPSSEIIEGEMVTMTCDVPGAKPEEIHYSWFKNSIWMKEGSGRSIIFQKVSSADTGYYNCKVQNDKGSDSSPPILLNVLYAPRIPTLSSFLETQEGKLAIIECTVDSNPTSGLQLQQDGQLIATTTSHSAPTQRLSVTSSRNSLKLKIQEVMLSDEGTYSCFAQNTVGNSTASLQFIVETARVVITPSSEIIEGIMVTLTCLATRNSETGTTYTWYKNGKQIREDLEKSILVFQTVSSGDAGSYYCTLQNSQGRSTSAPSTLHVLFSPRDITMTSMVTTQGRSLGIIQCSVDSDPPSQLSIYRKEALIASNSDILPNKRYNVLHSFNYLKVEIKDVLIEDEGLYTCLANNTFGNVSSSLVFTAETTKITIEPSSGVQEGDLISMTCILSSASDKETYLYTWYKNSFLYSEGPEHSLIFHKVSSDDSGSYHCKAANNESSKTSASISLNVEYPPRRTELKSFLDTEEGRLAFIDCTVDSYPPAELSLYRKNELVASSANHSISNPHYRVSFSRNSIKLEITNVMMADEGEYICKSKNTIGETSESIYFKVQTARILVTPSPDVLEGEKVTLKCDLTKTQLVGITYSWYKNSRWLQGSIDSSLVFEKILSRDAGYYYCRAHNTQESSVSPSVSLHVSYAPRDPVMSSFWEAQSGHVGILQCSVDSDPVSWLALYRKDTLVASSDSSKAPNERMKVSSSPNSLKLEIKDVMMEDEALYECIANNSIGMSKSTINFTAETTRIQITPSSRVLEGETVNMTCVVATDAPEDAKYSWYKNGNTYKDGTTRTLVFDNVSSDDGGSYYCTVQTDQGTKSSLTITLNVQYAPKNARIKSFLESHDGKVAIILCTVESNPPPEMSLFKEDQLIASSSSTKGTNSRIQAYFSLDTLRLEINNVVLSDEGTYVFTAKNVYGTTQISVDFTLEGVHVLVSPSTQLHEGDSVTMTCDVIANPQLVSDYTWYKNSRWLPDVSLGSLVFGSVTSSDGGSYSCTAHSSEGSRTSPPITIYVLYTPRKMSLTSFLETQERRLGVIACSVESHPPSQLSLHRGDDVLESSNSLQSNQRLKLSVSHNYLRLEIYDITNDDHGEYMCRANNSLGSIEKSIHFSVETARVAVSPSAELHEGASVNLTCEIPSKYQEKANYTWYKNNKWLKDGSDVSLIITGLTSSDAGSYHCLAKHGNISSISPMVGINVLYAPKNILMTSFLETHGRQQGIILCSADSVPVSVISLYKKDVLLASTTLFLAEQGQKFWASSSYNSIRLEIRDVTAEDSGTYICSANNTRGTATSSITFTVTDGEVLAYKIVASIAIISAVLLLASILVVIYWKKIKEKSTVQSNKHFIEMDNNGQS